VEKFGKPIRESPIREEPGMEKNCGAVEFNAFEEPLNPF
jgi:hypothetical protein